MLYGGDANFGSNVFFFSAKFAGKKNLSNKQTKLPLSFIEIAGLHEKQLWNFKI